MNAHLQTPSLLRGTQRSILVDCDGVLLDWRVGFHDFASEVLGRPFDPILFETHDAHEWLGYATGEEVMPFVTQFGNSAHFARLPSLPGAVEALRALHADGRNIHMITACSRGEQVACHRRQNLLETFGDIFAEVHFVDRPEDKAPLLSSYHRAVWLEDYPPNALQGLEAGHRTYVIRHPRSRDWEATSPFGILWVDGWSDILAAEAVRA